VKSERERERERDYIDDIAHTRSEINQKRKVEREEEQRGKRKSKDRGFYVA